MITSNTVRVAYGGECALGPPPPRIIIILNCLSLCPLWNVKIQEAMSLTIEHWKLEVGDLSEWLSWH